MYQRLRDLREDNGKKQSEIADMLQCTQQAYSTYERGERDIPSKVLIKLADYYNTSVDYLLGRTNNPAPPAP
ncbi:helix-turn-helix domain-containing protein [Agathobaculum sp.]|uniref:helix-turn-helix domain-containing protein n=1 Tax=Agathobaculum sp. TaxID=2048138 RepID=UPI0027B919B2|nr:helix-turn-helix transcriptional regulator [Agathobaculum sp.]MBS6641882.1 helix-turn-helix transcriptional regulator [Clostridiaceae bacterium]